MLVAETLRIITLRTKVKLMADILVTFMKIGVMQRPGDGLPYAELRNCDHGTFDFEF
jgi:hypothetical protein